MITLQAANQEIISIHSVQYGYKIKLYLSLLIEQFGSCLYSSDNGISFDYRILSVKFKLSEGEMISFVNFFKNTPARFNPITIILPDESNFYLAGPDKRDVGSYSVQLTKQSQSNLFLNPWKWFENDIEFQILSTPDTLIPTQRKEGNFEIGTVDGLRYPENNTPQLNMGKNFSRSLSGEIDILNFGKNADCCESNIIQPCNTSKAAKLIDFFQGVSGRGANILLQSPVKYFLFGPEDQNLNNITKLLTNIITMTHINYDRWNINFNLWTGSI